jgi:outer membrane protein TolC
MGRRHHATKRPAILCAAVFSMICFAAGCTFNEDVPKYRAVLDGPHPTTLPTYQPDEPLSLMRALRVANADNEAIGVSGESYIQSLAQKMHDAGTFLPTLSLAPSYSLSKGGGGGFTFGGAGATGGTSTGGFTLIPTKGNGISHDFAVPVGASVTGTLSNVSTLEAAGQTAEQRELLLLDERETILLQVAQSYYTCLKNERQVVVFENSVNFKS